MEVYMTNVAIQANDKGLHEFLRSHLADFAIYTYRCQKSQGRSYATLTTLDAQNTQQCLQQRLINLFYLGRKLTCRESKHKADPTIIKILEEEETSRLQGLKSRAKQPKSPTAVYKHPIKRTFGINALAVGSWGYNDNHLVYVSQARHICDGQVSFGTHSLSLLTTKSSDPQQPSDPQYRILIPYQTVRSFLTSHGPSISLTFTVSIPPRMYASGPEKDQAVEALNLSEWNQPERNRSRRVTHTAFFDRNVVSRCFVYRVQLDPAHNSTQVESLNMAREVPRPSNWSTETVVAHGSVTKDMSILVNRIAQHYTELPFTVKYQVQKLAQNGQLAPALVTALLPTIRAIYNRSGSSVTVYAVKRLFVQILYPGPETDAKEFSVERLKDCLRGNESQCKNESPFLSRYEEQQKHLSLVHHITITPTGVYFSGPDYERTNRVLRKYSKFSDYFLRVTFADEDGARIYFDRLGSNDMIYHERFQGMLNSTINIAGYGFRFLGFSHSALRSQTCWFMAPFTLNGDIMYAEKVIEGLGDFQNIRSAAKCAARIGQAFSETFSSIAVPKESLQTMPDVTRHARVFSDGVGTFSHDILDRIRDHYWPNQDSTVFQIRYAGAKGVISLDTRLKGSVLRLRNSMIKFNARDANDIEICGDAGRPLPMFLNRHLVKILEDLGVPNVEFLTLQRKAVEKLRKGIKSNKAAAEFLEQNSIGEKAGLPWLLRKLRSLKLKFQRDNFLRDTVEMSVLMRLREIKHRTRIPVSKGVTLYGIMDETGVLEEDEIYVTFDREYEKQELSCRVMVTRSPALHPGDVQTANAVIPPKDSPLRALTNCVAFSQKGERDLPSKLSGGDLDGDLYNIVWEEGLVPPLTEEPADYPRVEALDIGRSVNTQDMTAFFIQFMENDQLGRMATLHLVYSDISQQGTRDENCLRLADLCSQAVDFSKSGRPVNQQRIPRAPIARPDFMRTGPDLNVSLNITMNDTWADDVDEIDPENFADMPRKYEYYPSDKILGILYRDIDEMAFFHDLQKQSRPNEIGPKNKSVLESVWDHVQQHTGSVDWEKYVPEAVEIREMYEENLVDAMFSFSTHPQHPISELEAFVGYVIGRNGPQSKRQKEVSNDLKHRLVEDLAFTMERMLTGEAGGDEDDSRADWAPLARSIACLSLPVEKRFLQRERPKVGYLRSFDWIAATVCLRQVDDYLASFGDWEQVET